MRSDVRLQTECPWCGTVLARVTDARCTLDPNVPSRGLCELRCPSCARPLFLPLSVEEIALLLERGAKAFDGVAPVELLEHPDGPSITLDDVVHAVMELSMTTYPQQELL